MDWARGYKLSEVRNADGTCGAGIKPLDVWGTLVDFAVEQVTSYAIGAVVGVATGGLGLLASHGVSRFLKSSVHHIATNKNFIKGQQWSRQFLPIFQRAGMTLNDALNKVAVYGHRGPHSDQYHTIIRQRLLQATRGLNGPAYTSALQNELRTLASELQTTGSLLNKLVTQ